MKKKEFSPYATFSYNKVAAPKNTKVNEPKCNRISSDNDLRGGKKNGRA